jgi:hypothetical protein
MTRDESRFGAANGGALRNLCGRRGDIYGALVIPYARRRTVNPLTLRHPSPNSGRGTGVKADYAVTAAASAGWRFGRP